MAVQPSLRPDEETALFPDGRANRPPVPGTVARGQLRTDRHLFAGQRSAEPRDWARPVLILGAAGWSLVPALAVAVDDDRSADTFPFPVTREVLEHGRDRYTIYCAICHDAAGTGRGKIVERGYT